MVIKKLITHTDYDTEFHGESASQDHCNSLHSYFSTPQSIVSFPSSAPASFAICSSRCAADVLYIVLITNYFYSLTVEDTESSVEHLSPVLSKKNSSMASSRDVGKC